MTLISIEAVQHRIARTADWRRSLAAEYPDDPRNEKAARRLEELARAEPHGVSPDTLSALAEPLSSTWLRNAVSEVARDIEFRRDVPNLDAFLRLIVEKIKH